MKTQREIFSWLKNNYGKCLGGLTSTDTYALVTSVNLCNLIAHESAPQELFDAYRAIVNQMQDSQQWLAWHAIPCELDWWHRQMIWEKAGLPPVRERERIGLKEVA